MAILGSSITNALERAEASTGEYEALPEGQYILRCEAAEVKDTNSGGGQYIKATFVVIAPKYEGRKLFINYNIRNSNAQAEQIGLSELKAFMLAGGHGARLTDSDELIGLTISAKVGIQKSKDPKYKDGNKISKYEPVSAARKAAAPAPAPQGDSFGDAFAPTGTDGGGEDWFK